jgi:hypothetical protein
MAKVVGIHEVELRPDVQAADFERFVLEEFIPAHQQLAGFEIALLKGDRGQRSGQYVIVGTNDSIERRDQLFPLNGEFSEEIQRVLAENAAMWEKLRTFVVAFPDPQFTDYVALGK